jgi:uncharacterized SAM-binding protein YcdF (DUF218 family)
MNSPLDSLQILSDYLAWQDPLPKHADILMLLGSSDLKVAEQAASVFKQGFADYLAVCGGIGRLTGNLGEPESLAYRKVLLKAGIAEEKIICESRSTNTEENIRFGMAELAARKLRCQSVILVQIPPLQRRAVLTFKKHFPNHSVFSFAAYKPDLKTLAQPKLNELCSIVLGELERLQRYGPNGTNFIVDPQIPSHILDLYAQVTQGDFISV